VLVQPGPKVVTLSRAAADKVESDAKAPALLAAVGYLAGSDWLLMTRPFKEARDFARGVGPKTQREWQEWAKSDKRPPDIPSNPRQVYSEEWRGWGDWLGIGSARGGIPGVYKPFEEARKFVRRQGLVF
jgi:integrase-like protein